MADLWCEPAGWASAAEKVPERLPEALVAAWQKAGAQPGWMSIGPFDFLYFREGEAGKAGEWPAFRFRDWEARVLGKLPRPERAFGLDLSATTVTDAGLKELATLKQLQTLELDYAKVTGSGVATLRKALPGCTIIR